MIRQMIRAEPEQRIPLNNVALVLRIDHAGNMFQNGRLSSYDDGYDARNMRNGKKISMNQYSVIHRKVTDKAKKSISGTEFNDSCRINQTYQPQQRQQENQVYSQQLDNGHTAEHSASRSSCVDEHKPAVDSPTQGIKKKSILSKLFRSKKGHSKHNSYSDLQSSLPVIEENGGSSVSGYHGILEKGLN